MTKPQLKYHCDVHPDRAPFCAIGDYTPCRECYFKFRGIKIALIILCISCFSWVSLFACNIPGDRFYRHDPNIPCREIVPDYSRHPCYGKDCRSMVYFYEYWAHENWENDFFRHWLQCDPYGDPIRNWDVNFDGHTDLQDFAILSTYPLYYKTKTGTKYHARGCVYLRASKVPLITPAGLQPCAVCIAVPVFLKE